MKKIGFLEVCRRDDCNIDEIHPAHKAPLKTRRGRPSSFCIECAGHIDKKTKACKLCGWQYNKPEYDFTKAVFN